MAKKSIAREKNSKEDWLRDEPSFFCAQYTSDGAPNSPNARKGSIGQTEARAREKCPIEGLYRTNRSRNKRKVSNRKSLLDTYELKTDQSVRYNLAQPVLMVRVRTSMIGKDIFLEKLIEHLFILFPVLAIGLGM